MQKQLLDIELQNTKISTKGVQRLIIIPKELHKNLEMLEDQQYLSEITIYDKKKIVAELKVIGKISKMAEQRQIFIPMHLHSKLIGLKGEFRILISIKEI